MNYYEHHLGDYAQATAHLSFVEDAAYSRLIRKYYAQEKPLPADIPSVQRLIGARDKTERAAVETVLREFFELLEDGWHNRRCDEEIERYRGKQAKAKRSAEARWSREPQHTDGNANAMRTHSEGNAHQTPDTSHQTPSSSTKKKSSPVGKPVDVSDEVWGSFLTVRKTKKAAVTDIAVLGIRREAVKAGITFEQALTMCCERGWAGFKADWVQGQQAKPQAESFYERDLRLKREEAAKWGGGSSTSSDDFLTIDAEVTHVPAIESH
jgi:uncharacterized protein YdaU (DUF1376 family)